MSKIIAMTMETWFRTFARFAQTKFKPNPFAWTQLPFLRTDPYSSPKPGFRATDWTYQRSPLFTSTQLGEIKIYTKTGDKGTSALFTGERRYKDDAIFNALGTTDELSSSIAVAREHALVADHPYAERLLRIQCIIQDVASVIATPNSSARDAHKKKVGLSHRHTEELEEWIDEYTKELPPLQNFILPGGGQTSSHLHIARAVCRRAERCVTPLAKLGEIDPEAMIYLNRLSDFLFTAARLAAKLDLKQEEIYIRSGEGEDIEPRPASKKKTKSQREAEKTNPPISDAT